MEFQTFRKSIVSFHFADADILHWRPHLGSSWIFIEMPAHWEVLSVFNIHFLLSRCWSAASCVRRIQCSSQSYFSLNVKHSSFLFSFCTRLLWSVQIITAHMVIHNHNSLVSLCNKLHTHTLCPSSCCPNGCSIVIWPQHHINKFQLFIHMQYVQIRHLSNSYLKQLQT